MLSRGMAAWRLAILLLFAGYAILLYRNTSRAAGGADSSGYLNAAKLIGAGRFSRPLPIPPEVRTRNRNAFLPLGFLPRSNEPTMVPLYPLGFPAHLAFAAWIGGWRAAPFYVAPVAALATLLLTYLLARRFARPTIAWIAVACLAACPVFLFMAVQSMSDVVAAAWCAAAVLAATSDRKRAVVIAGAAFGVAVLVRPASIVLLLPLLLLIRPRNYVWAGLGGLPFALILFWINWRLFDSPLASGYSQIGLVADLTLRGSLTRAASYVYWTLRQLGPAVVIGWIASLWIPYAPLRIRIGLAGWFAVFLLFYATYDLRGPWWYTRFLLPAYPGLIVAAAIVAEQLLRSGRRLAMATAVVMAAVSLTAALSFARESKPLTIDEAQRHVVEVTDWLRENLPAGSMVMSMELSGAIVYYTEHYPLRWDWVSRDEMRSYVDTAAARGRSSWAVLMNHEMAEAEGLLGPLGKPEIIVGPFQVIPISPSHSPR
jgi:hypothetical protein